MATIRAESNDPIAYFAAALASRSANGETIPVSINTNTPFSNANESDDPIA